MRESNARSIIRAVAPRLAKQLKRALGIGLLVLLGYASAGVFFLSGSNRAPSSEEVKVPGSVAEAEQWTMELFQRASPSVVQIATFTRGTDPSDVDTKIGSGFVWDAAGNIVTNEHVIHNATTIMVWLASGEWAEAQVVGATADYDLAVIRLKTGTAPSPSIALGAAKGLRVGQFAYAIGCPFGLDQSLTIGVISALDRELPTDNGGMILHVIQTDAGIFPGNSGGPLLDSSGRLIGVNTIGYSLNETHRALGFAIPVELVKRVVPELISNGRALSPGVGITPAADVVAIQLRSRGVVIASIEPGSPAARAGLQAADLLSGGRGDIVTVANGQPVRTVRDLMREIEQLGVGKRIELGVERAGTPARVELEIVDVASRRR
jgi:2-alkenal reductase